MTSILKPNGGVRPPLCLTFFGSGFLGLWFPWKFLFPHSLCFTRTWKLQYSISVLTHKKACTNILCKIIFLLILLFKNYFNRTKIRSRSRIQTCWKSKKIRIITLMIKQKKTIFCAFYSGLPAAWTNTSEICNLSYMKIFFCSETVKN